MSPDPTRSEGYKDYITWAKAAAEKARVIARKLNKHFGRRSVAAVQEDRRRFEQRMAELYPQKVAA